jgi:uncharacterized membrane protein
MSLLNKEKPLIDPEGQDRIVALIKKAEEQTTGEIRVFVEKHCKYVDALDMARELFTKLGMANTERRNAVLVYLAMADRQFAIFGDEEIYNKAGGPLFWENAASELKNYLRAGQVVDGLCVCVNELAKALAQHFPYDPTITKNELPDDIVFGK